MKSGVPWNVLGVSPETRDMAREAARRSGMPLGVWLDTIIGDSARDEGARMHVHGHRAEDDDSHASQNSLEAVNQRLDDITRQLDLVASGQSTAPQPPRQSNGGRGELPPQGLADIIARLDSRLDQLISENRSVSKEIEQRGSADDQPLVTLDQEPIKPNNWSTGIDQAVAEIAARQRVLDGEPPLARAPAPARHADPVPRSPTQDVTRLEQQLRNITERIETLNRPCAFEDAAGPLRAQLSEIAQTLNDALPRRALESLENEVRTLAGRIDQTRHSGADTATISGIEHGLAEVRDALRALTPAESLVGLDGAVKALSQKIELIAATHQDPEALRQLEAAVTGLHSVVSHVASNDALAVLTDEVRSLAEKIDGVATTGSAASGDALMALEQRIATLADALEARHHGGETVPPQIDAIVNSLIERIEQVQLSRGDHAALGHLENRIAELVERLDASDARLGNLEAIERGLVDLLVHLEEMRSGNGAGTIRPGGPQSGSAASQPQTDALEKEIAELKQADRRTQDTLEDVHGTIGHVVDRLAKVEQDVRTTTGSPTSEDSEAAKPPAADVPAPAQTLAPTPDPAPAHAVVAPKNQAAAPPPAAVAAPAAPLRPLAGSGPANSVAPRLPIDPNLPPDHPLEPGSGAGRGHTAATPAERIASSEAALTPAKPPVIPDPGGKPDFIAAARRAAQAAAAEKPDHGPSRYEPHAQDREPIGQRLSKRMRSLFVGAAVAVIAIGALHVAKNFLMEAEPDISELPGGKVATEVNAVKPDALAAPSVSPEPPPASAAPQAGPQLDETTAVPPSSALMPPAGVLDLEAQPPSTPPSDIDRKAAPAAADITGSVPLPPTPPAAARSPQAPAATAMPESESAGTTLPVKIGGTPLRIAAAKGDAAAAYEVATRYAEGRRIQQNLKEAAHWFELAAKAGLAPAQFRLGALYEKGQGVRKDLIEARRLYVAAAEKGHAKAMHNLAVLYAEGIDGKPVYTTAAKWFRKAAERGITDSQYNLGILYARGIGVGRNLAESYKWFALAAREGDKEAAKKRDDVAARLDQQSLMAARLAVQTWTAEPEPTAATEVKTPPGGWDRSAAPAASPKQTRS